MPLYEYTIKFEAEDNAEADDLVHNPTYGAYNAFGDVHEEKLVNLASGQEVK